ncbi:hypothetical protein F4820DRAFT_403186 [Hypoxylon rubiginosum]|uniref:Uncharacterized protein n=1 Tax=Hypoxylon rubiginosum TaxID=110542 RepID=A0ACB9ZH19_9PEZI|nr:hypothetical protein F4820DRAFT_403186 [Hypoxylon rubiginosum]
MRWRWRGRGVGAILKVWTALALTSWAAAGKRFLFLIKCVSQWKVGGSSTRHLHFLVYCSSPATTTRLGNRNT